MTIEWVHVLAFNLALLAAIASPGPSLLFLVRTAMAEGRAAGLFAALGLGVMAPLWTLAALLGLDVLFTLFPWAYSAVKIGGAAYLIWIAVQTWRHARAPIAQTSTRDHRRAFLQGLLINLANPKSVLFAAAVIVVIFPEGLTTADKALIYLNHLAVELVLQPALAIALSTGVVRRRYLGAKPIFDRIAACVLGALGLRLLLERG
ncbi:LysE family translocator [Hasllibacter sp. MH4015]|uniref:LysE family translocator n=1 Tax=Hasllibacter sp. MH4015 TaxID=2854029 RepID=UPI001CD60C2E|nr:LysE family transporter [Hasllibacter sp. MH4015]